jgi:hypothetical protein
MRVATALSTLQREVSMTRSGLAGTSYGDDTPVNCAILPIRAWAYMPFESRWEQTSAGAEMKVSRNPAPIIARAISRFSVYEINFTFVENFAHSWGRMRQACSASSGNNDRRVNSCELNSVLCFCVLF